MPFPLERGQGLLGYGGEWQPGEHWLKVESAREDYESEFAQVLTAHRTVNDPYGATAKRMQQLPDRGHLLTDLRLSRESFPESQIEVHDPEQLLKNAGAITLVEEWLREADKGVDPKEKSEWEEIAAAIDAHRSSPRKLFP